MLLSILYKIDFFIYFYKKDKEFNYFQRVIILFFLLHLCYNFAKIFYVKPR
jgi:hypothetical protein